MRAVFSCAVIAAALLTAISPLNADKPSAKPGIPAVQQPMAELSPAAVIAIAKTADWVAITPGAVWVAGAHPDVVRKIDPATNRVVATALSSRLSRPAPASLPRGRQRLDLGSQPG